MYKLQISVLILILFIIVGCSAEKRYLDAEANITDFYKTSRYSNQINVEYNIENIGEELIRGWNIFFRVSMKSGNQVVVSDGLTYQLNQDEHSDEILATGKVPKHFKPDDIPISAAVKFIEVY